MASRACGAGSKPQGPAVQVLTKPEAQRICRADAALPPYKDEKLEIYHQHHSVMDAAFEKARGHCKQELTKYEDRNREVAEKLKGIMQRTDGEAKRQQERMKDFSSEFDDSIVHHRKEWLIQLASNEAEVGEKSRAVSEDLAGLNAAIAEEGVACKRETASAMEPLAKRLVEQRELLEQQASGREEWHAGFKEALGKEFSHLRQRLAQEAEARKQQHAEVAAEVKKRYADLRERLQKQDKMAHTWLEDLQSRLEQERAKRTSAHQKITQNAMTFMVEFEKHIAEAQKMKQATGGALREMRMKLRSDEPP